MRLGIRYRLLLPLALLLAGVVAAGAWGVRSAARRAEERVAGQVRNVSQTLATANYPLNRPVLEQIKSYSGAEFAYLPTDGPMVQTFVGDRIELPSDDDLAGGDAGLGPTVMVAGRPYRCRRLPLRPPSFNAGGVVYIFYPEALLDEAVADARRPALFGLALAVVSLLLTVGVGQRLVGRIRELERRTRTIAAGDFSPMPLPRANDELRDLSASVNDMADKLARLQAAVAVTERLRLSGQLATGLAHQLRNGVTGARLALQIHRAEPDDEALDVVLRQLAQIEANVRRFIDLGRLADGTRSRVSLTKVVSDAVELHLPRCRHVGIELVFEKPDDVFVQGEPAALADIVLNLLSNAIDAVGAAGSVEVRMRCEGGSAVVEVSDTGPGPPPDLAARLFDPFVTGKPEGIGLGLAVAKHAAESHGGGIDWSRAAGRTVFRVRLPLAGD